MSRIFFKETHVCNTNAATAQPRPFLLLFNNKLVTSVTWYLYYRSGPTIEINETKKQAANHPFVVALSCTQSNAQWDKDKNEPIYFSLRSLATAKSTAAKSTASFVTFLQKYVNKHRTWTRISWLRIRVGVKEHKHSPIQSTATNLLHETLPSRGSNWTTNYLSSSELCIWKTKEHNYRVADSLSFEHFFSQFLSCRRTSSKP